MRKLLVLLAILVIIAIVLFATGFWRVDQTRKGALPDVNINASGGQLPAFDVDSKKVVVGTKDSNVEVPKIETEKKKVELPTVGVEDNGNQ